MSLLSLSVAAAGLFSGLHCHENARWPGPTCPYALSCTPLVRGRGSNVACSTWVSGTFAAPPHAPLAAPDGLADLEAAGTVLQGRWRPAGTDLKPPELDVCEMAHGGAVCHREAPVSPPPPAFVAGDAWLTPLEAAHVLRGYHVVFVGDSMLRQLFVRFIFHQRGLGEVVEHRYEPLMRGWCYWRNATHDLLQISDTCEAPHGLAEASFLLQFFWDTNAYPSVLRVVAALQRGGLSRKAAVLGINYWRNGDAGTKEAAQFEPLVAAVGPSSFFWYPVPRVGDVSTTFAERNDFYRNWTRARGGHVLPTDRMHVTGAFPLRSDFAGDPDPHYMCDWRRKLSEPMVAESFEKAVKTPPNGDCRDLFNLNVVQMILARLWRP